MSENLIKKLRKLAQIFLSEPQRIYPEDTEYIQGVRDAGKRLLLELQNHNI